MSLLGNNWRYPQFLIISSKRDHDCEYSYIHVMTNITGAPNQPPLRNIRYVGAKAHPRVVIQVHVTFTNLQANSDVH